MKMLAIIMLVLSGCTSVPYEHLITHTYRNYDTSLLSNKDIQKLINYDAENLIKASTWDNVIYKGPRAEELADRWCKAGGGCSDAR